MYAYGYANGERFEHDEEYSADERGGFPGPGKVDPDIGRFPPGLFLLFLSRRPCLPLLSLLLFAEYLTPVGAHFVRVNTRRAPHRHDDDRVFVQEALRCSASARSATRYCSYFLLYFRISDSLLNVSRASRMMRARCSALHLAGAGMHRKRSERREAQDESS